ncbi:MAG: cytochrome o ubiquinol oxidase subunit IV [Gammaproteobacteria bacterium]|nr:MAG: cytochrome o ubiquinol oxidase subunit IV [Gammaproteobacteria bacterium]
MTHSTHHEESHGSMKQYVIGLILSIVLTAIPFAVVMSGAMSTSLTYIIVLVCAVAQVLVQMIFFLHLDTSDKQYWNLMSGLYTVFILGFIVIGSIWIFEHLHYNLLMGH